MTDRHPGGPHRQTTTCCIVGAGPAGVVLALLLARKRVDVLLLEAHADFDRDFRGDTVHPAILEILDAVGVAERVLALPHSKVHTATIPTPAGPAQLADFGRLRTRFPFIALIPQARFLECLTTEAARYPSFRLVMGARVEELVEENGIVRGVRYRAADGWHEVRALLTVGADGRFSRVRQLSGLPPAIATSPPMDILWFRLPRRPDDPSGALGQPGPGRVVVLLDRVDQWQVGYVFPKGSYQRLRAAGLDALRRQTAEAAPLLADRVEHLTDWKQVSLLSVSADYLPRWYRPGLLLIGDAAHVMSPVGGNGINYAVQDAAAAANILAEPLLRGRLTLGDLAAVQRRRGWPTRLTQAVVSLIQDQVLARALRADRAFQPPAALRLLRHVPLLNLLPAYWVAFGIWPVRVRP